jgi:hypothetical protein
MMFGIHRLYAIQDNSNPSSLGTDQVLDLVGKSSKSSSSILLKGSSSSGGSNSSGHNATAPTSGDVAISSADELALAAVARGRYLRGQCSSTTDLSSSSSSIASTGTHIVKENASAYDNEDDDDAQVS